MIIAAAILLTACDDTTGGALSVRSLETINLSAKVGSRDGLTRACTEDNLQSTQFVAGKEIYVEVYETGLATAYTAGIYTTGAEGALTGNLYYPANNGAVDLCAYYPSSVTSASTAFSVSNDQRTEAAYQASDLMYATKLTNKSSNATHNLTFNHALAKVVVNLIAGGGMTTANITTSPGVTAVKISGTVLNAQLAISGGVITASKTAAGSAADINITGTILNNIGIIVPQTVAANTTFITVTYEGVDYTCRLAEAKTFEAGKVYTYTVTVNTKQIDLSADTISDWTEFTVDTLNTSATTNDWTEFEVDTVNATAIITDWSDGSN